MKILLQLLLFFFSFSAAAHEADWVNKTMQYMQMQHEDAITYYGKVDRNRQHLKRVADNLPGIWRGIGGIAHLAEQQQISFSQRLSEDSFLRWHFERQETIILDRQNHLTVVYQHQLNF